MAFVQYNHGVEIFVAEGKLRAGCDTWHGHVTKPTVILDRSIRALQVKILRKQREMRFGVVDLPGYIEAMEKEKTSGASWCRKVFRGGTAIFLCCYEPRGAVLFSGNKELAQFSDFTLRDGDTIAVTLARGSLSFIVEGQPEIKHDGVLAEQLLGVQFHTTDDAVALNPFLYVHGVETRSRALKAVCRTVHGQPEKPTIVFAGPMAVRIEKKTAEMRFGVVDLPRYMAAVKKGAPGQSWFSTLCSSGVAVFLCCYREEAVVSNGNALVASLEQLRVAEGSIVAMAKDGGSVRFLVDGKEVARAPAKSSSLFALQLHATGDSVRLLSGDPSAPSGSSVGPPSTPPGKSVRHDLPALQDAVLPQQLQEHLPPDGFLLRPVARDEEYWKAIAKIFTVTRPAELHVGKDVPKDGFPAYDAIKVAAAWQILGWKNVEYVGARDFLSWKLKKRTDLVPSKLETSLDGHCSPFVLNTSVTEKLLLHGTRPECVMPILANGLNEKFFNGIFGSGTYLAEDVEKIDQYVRLDAGFQADGTLKELHTRVYGDASRHPGNCFYGFVCRASLGCVVRTRDGDTPTDPSICGSLWAVPHRELAAVPGSVPDEHFHGLVVEKGGLLTRHREFVVFHSARVLPEFLVAFHRTHKGVAVP